MSEKRALYDHKIDQKDFKWSGKSKLKIIDKFHLPKYISQNLDSYDKWLD